MKHNLFATPAIALVALALLAACPKQSDPHAGHGDMPATAESTDQPAAPLPHHPTLPHSALPLESAAGSYAPRLSPDPDGGLVLSWLETVGETGHRLKFARWATGAERWSEPVLVAEGESMFANWADVPGVLPLGNGRLVAWWLETIGEEKYGYGPRIVLSEDGGATWGDARWLQDDQQSVEHGFVSAVGDGAGGAHFLWLDGRPYADDDKRTTLRARQMDSTGSLGPESEIDPRVCDCCTTDLQALPGDRLLAVYRDRYDGELRDTARALFAEGAWQPTSLVHPEAWDMPGCPVNGPAVDAVEYDLVLAWYTAESDVPRVMVSRSPDGGAGMLEAQQVNTTLATGRVDVVQLPNGRSVVSWVEAADTPSGSALKLRVVGADSQLGEPKVVTDLSGAYGSGFPKMARVGDELVFVWTQMGESKQLKSLRIPLP